MKLVIDGYAFFYTAFDEVARFSELSSGGRYDHFEAELKRRFHFLQHWQIDFVVYLDGVSARDKLEHSIFEFKKRLKSISNVQTGEKAKARLHPPLLRVVFLSVLKELNIEYYVTDGEADPYLAKYARENNAYILSNDSDCLMFPHHPGLINVAEFSFNHTTCEVFTPAHTAATFKFPEELLPMFASLAGNDYTASRPFVRILSKSITNKWPYPKSETLPRTNRERYLRSLGVFLKECEKSEVVWECLKLFTKEDHTPILTQLSLDIILESCNRYKAEVTLPTLSNVTPTFAIGDKTYSIPENALQHVRKGDVIFTVTTGTLLRKALTEDFSKETCFHLARLLNRQVVGITCKMEDGFLGLPEYTEYFRSNAEVSEMKEKVPGTFEVDQSPLPTERAVQHER